MIIFNINLYHIFLHSSGLYLAVKPTGYKSNKLNEVRTKDHFLTLEKRITEDSLFVLKIKDKNKNKRDEKIKSFMSLDSFFFLLHAKTNLVVGLDQDNFGNKSNIFSTKKNKF